MATKRTGVLALVTLIPKVITLRGHWPNWHCLSPFYFVGIIAAD